MTDKRARRILPVDLNSILDREEAVNPQVSDRGESCGRENYYNRKTERSPAKNCFLYRCCCFNNYEEVQLCCNLIR